MTTSLDPALISRLSGEFTALGTQMGALGRDLELLRERMSSVPPVRLEHAPASGALVSAQPVPAQADSTSDATEVVSFGEDAGSECDGLGEPASQRDMAPAPLGESTTAASGAPADPVRSAHVPIAGPPAPPRAAPPLPAMPGQPVPMPPRPPGTPVPGYVSRIAPAPGALGWGAAASWAPGVVPPMPPPHPPVPPRAERARAPQPPWWQRDGVISRILAAAGVAVTLIGVVMLLVLAAQAGLFGPVPRVAAGAVFSAALVVAGLRVFGRTGGRVGGIALAATGIAGAYLDVVAVTAIYHWLHPALGFAVALGVAAGGVWLAARWRAQPLAVLVVLAAALLSPVLSTRPILLAFLIVLHVAFVPVQAVRDWPYLHVARTVPAALATFVFIAGAILEPPVPHERAWLLTAAAALALAGLAGTIPVVRRRPTDLTASLMTAVATTPILIAPGMYQHRFSAVLVASAAAAVLLLVAAVPMVPKLGARARIPAHTAVVAAIAGAIAVLEACVGATRPHTLPVALFLVALAFLGVAGQQRSRIAAGVGSAFAVLGGLTLLGVAGPEVLASQYRSEANLGMATVLGAVLALAVIAVALWCARRLSGTSAGGGVRWIAASVAGLYAVTATTVSIGVATGARQGFLIGHSAATILWMAAATAVLLFGLRRLAVTPAVARLTLGSGLSVTAAAVAKLFLFDLATLDGLLRVAAFIAVGMLLLLVGTRYARAFAESGAGGQADTGKQDVAR